MSDFIRVGGVQKLQDGEFIFQVFLSLSLWVSYICSSSKYSMFLNVIV